MSMHVAVVIVGYRNADDVCACLSALARQCWSDFEVAICENGGEAAFAELAARAPDRLAGGQRVSLIDASGNSGFAGGVNRCMAASADAEAWWLLNPDAEPEPEALAALVRRLEKGDCSAAGGVLYGHDGRIQSLGGLWRPWLARGVSLGFARDAAPEPAAVERRLNYLSGASMLVSRRFFAAAGPMREDYFLYCEEVDWCLRAQRAGARLGFTAEARVRHAGGSTTGANANKSVQPRLPVFLNERNRLLLTRAIYPLRLPAAAVAALLLILLRYGRRGAWPQLRWAIAGWAAGLAGRRGAPPSASSASGERSGAAALTVFHR